MMLLQLLQQLLLLLLLLPPPPLPPLPPLISSPLILLLVQLPPPPSTPELLPPPTGAVPAQSPPTHANLQCRRSACSWRLQCRRRNVLAQSDRIFLKRILEAEIQSAAGWGGTAGSDFAVSAEENTDGRACAAPATSVCAVNGTDERNEREV